MDASNISQLTLEAGEAMLTNGAETYRVEETMERMGAACGAREFEVFVTPTGILMSVTDGDGQAIAKVRRVRSLNTDLSKVSRVNEISRRLTSAAITPFEAMELLRELKVGPPAYTEATRAISSGLGSAAFTVLFGGGVADIIPAFLGGLSVNWVVSAAQRVPLSRFVAVLGGGLTAAMVGTVAGFMFDTVHLNQVVIGNIMILVPGVAMTNAIRDVMSGELVAGGSRFIEAMVTAVSVAVGVVIWLSLWEAVVGR